MSIQFCNFGYEFNTNRGYEDKIFGVDSFVVETNIHYPTDANLIVDGVRKITNLASRLAALLSLSGWRQDKHN